MRTYPASSLETRLVRLETRNRLLVALWVVTAALLAAAHAFPDLLPPGVVRAERYQLTDPEGTVRAELRLEGDVATLQLLDEAGNVRAILREAAWRGERPADPQRSAAVPAARGAATP